MRNGGHEAGKNWEECGEGQAAMLRELVWMLKWLSELTTLRILRRQNSSQRNVNVIEAGVCEPGSSIFNEQHLQGSLFSSLMVELSILCLSLNILS